MLYLFISHHPVFRSITEKADRSFGQQSRIDFFSGEKQNLCLLNASANIVTRDNVAQCQLEA